MAKYGLLDASNLIVADKLTGDIALYIDYANSVTHEWDSESTSAMAKGVEAVTWEHGRTGTLTVESDLFDWKYISMIVGSELKRGEESVMRRVVTTVDETRAHDLKGQIEPGSIVVFPLDADGMEEEAILNLSNEEGMLNAMPTGLVASVNDETAQLTWDLGNLAEGEKYQVKRDGAVVGTVAQNSFLDEGLTPETDYEYTIVIEKNGVEVVSPAVSARTSEAGSTSRSTFEPTSLQISTAEENARKALGADSDLPGFTIEGSVVQFNDKVQERKRYAIYFEEKVVGTQTVTINKDEFARNYEIFADAFMKTPQGRTDLIQIHFKNATPQSNFSFTQSASDPTSLSVTFNLTPDEDGNLATYKIIQ